MGEEADTETFAFQAEINQLLSLIINVRFFCKVVLFSSALFFARSIFDDDGDERFFVSFFRLTR